MPALESGIISLWFGSVASIPAGFVLCDGNNGTPNLKNKFIIGAGDTYDPGDTGGSTAHTHPFTGDGHFHNLLGGTDLGPGTSYSVQTDVQAVTGTTGSKANVPPYHALCYIMKT